MTILDYEIALKGTLELNEDNNGQTLLSESLRLEMFLIELQNAKSVPTVKTMMMQDIIKKTKDDNQKLYDRCHVNTHVKSGGGGGFTNSYQKNC